jgi:hypothetical protein
MKHTAALFILFLTVFFSGNAQNTYPYPGSGAITLDGLTIRNGNLVLQNPSVGYPILWLKDVSGTKTVKLDYNSLMTTGGTFYLRSSSNFPLAINDTGGKVGIGTNAPEEALQVGNSNQRDINMRIGESAWIGVTSTHAETIIGNNARVSGTNVVAASAQNGASAISLKWFEGIRFYTTRSAVALNEVINQPTKEKFRITPDAGVFAEEVTVALQGQWPDFVFQDNYPLQKLSDVEKFIRQNKHLPNIPSEKEILDTGIQLGGFANKLLRKTEELTLYIIDQDKKLERLESENRAMKERLARIESMLTSSGK